MPVILTNYVAEGDLGLRITLIFISSYLCKGLGHIFCLCRSHWLLVLGSRPRCWVSGPGSGGFGAGVVATKSENMMGESGGMLSWQGKEGGFWLHQAFYCWHS